MHLERDGEDFCIDAAVLGDLLEVQSHEVQPLMRAKKITSVCERGEGEHNGQFRLTFLYKSRHVRIDVDNAGQVMSCSTIDLAAAR